MLLLTVAALVAVTMLVPAVVFAHHPDGEAKGSAPADSGDLERWMNEDKQPPKSMKPRSHEPCVKGMAGPFPCENVGLESYLPLSVFGSERANDIWGWTDPATKKDYALIGLDDGTGFIDISDTKRPVYLGKLPTQTASSIWRDIKVYNNHAFVVSEARGHGMQVFDLTRLRGQTEPQTWTVDAHYAEFGNAHNIAINEDTGFAYPIGSNTCEGGPHVVNIQNPTAPTFAGCIDEDGYTHDTQVVVYNGPDERFQGREIAFSSNEDTLTIVDVTDKENPRQLSRLPYDGATYAHQGWLTEDQSHFLLGDEVDELRLGHNTRTYIFDVSNLTDPVNTANHTAETEAIDHNLYIKGNYVHQANYRAGYRLLDGSNIENGELTEVGFFDIYPADDDAQFNGAWSNFPYYDKNIVVVSGIEQGLFVLKPQLKGPGGGGPGSGPGGPPPGKGPGGPPGRR
ncbi:MAG: choice-of-anchor B family protein [Rubrobacter sp.]|nr:choice-of-anchor B family protein [Rubrobacter sp.]